MTKPRLSAILLLLALDGLARAEVLDVNGDGIVGPAEALELSDLWRQPAKGAEDHNHLGQTWSAAGNTLEIQGSAPTALLRLNNSGGDGFSAVSEFSGSYAATFISTAGRGVYITAASDNRPDILLGASSGGNDNGVLASDLDDADSDLVLQSNDLIELQLDKDANTSSHFRIRNGSGNSILQLDEDGNLNITGNYESSLKVTQVDHPLDPSGKTLRHYSADSPEAINIYSGNALLGKEGTAVVRLPDYFEAYNADYRYQLTCVGGFASVYVSEEIANNRFTIAGGAPGLKVSWEVTAVRKDPFAVEHARTTEIEKAGAESGLFFHPEVHGERTALSMYAGREP